MVEHKIGACKDIFAIKSKKNGKKQILAIDQVCLSGV